MGDIDVMEPDASRRPCDHGNLVSVAARIPAPHGEEDTGRQAI